ncbi:chaperone modulator CbpM [Ideonella sp. A 288]|uniref:chaperone modulator CbpM n=1 Tax=Ideonella sp. A 288 TaxID=1962181 RepID=UPI000B4A6D58|nr:chaperone modulator CbpM [Ideonella sp. A 288]
MSFRPSPPEGPPEDSSLDLEALCRLTGVDAAWVLQRVAEGLLAPRAARIGESRRFDAATLHRARCMLWLESEFEAGPELAALVADLQEQIGTLRQQLRLLGH